METKRAYTKIIAAAVFLLMPATVVHAQGDSDGTRALTITLQKNMTKKAIGAEIAAQGLVTVGHTWIESEVSQTNTFQKEFQEYLDSLHNTLMHYAEAYGLYYEVTQLSKNIREMAEIIAERPTSPLAVAASARQSRMKTELIGQCASIVNDVRKVFDRSATEKERNEVMSGIRPRLRNINRNLHQLNFALRCASLTDLWYEILGKAKSYERRDRYEIIEGCMEQWRESAHNIYR